MKQFFSALFLFSITSLTFAQNSILFDASDQQYLTISNADDRFNATADFTYEVWVKFTSKGFNGQRLAPFFGGQQHDYAALIDNRIGMRLNSNGVCSGDRTFGNITTIDTDIWYHIAYVRSGSVVSLYLDGTLLGTTECAQEDGSVKGVWMINANTINIGAIFWNTSYLDGYIGGMRYVVGTALYSEDFNPQLRWEKTNETILLMNIKNEDAAFTDESDYSNTITLNGSSSTPTFVDGNGPTLPADILLSGDVSAENNQIKNIADPTHTQDAATKGYVDSNVNSFSGSYNDLTDKPTTITTDQANEISANTNKVTFPGFGTSSGTALEGNTALFSGSYSDLTDTPVVYTQAQVDALISNLQNEINELKGEAVDNENNSYSSVSYGIKNWTIENANVVTYRDGTPIPEFTGTNDEWKNLTTGAWCYYNDDPNNEKLYNWFAVAGIYNSDSLNDSSLRKEFAPEGWHVPSRDEWTDLVNYLTSIGVYDGQSIASKTGWNSSTVSNSPGYNQDENNSSYFNIYPVGLRSNNFNSAGNYAFFWTSTEVLGESYGPAARGRGLHKTSTGLTDSIYEAFRGFSVRFIKD